MEVYQGSSWVKIHFSNTSILCWEWVCVREVLAAGRVPGGKAVLFLLGPRILWFMLVYLYMLHEVPIIKRGQDNFWPRKFSKPDVFLDVSGKWLLRRRRLVSRGPLASWEENSRDVAFLSWAVTYDGMYFLCYSYFWITDAPVHNPLPTFLLLIQ